MNTHNYSNIEQLQSYNEHDIETINAANKSPSPPIQFKSEAANIYYNAMRVKNSESPDLQQQHKKKKKQEKKKIRWNKKTKKGKPTTANATIPSTPIKVEDTPRTTSYYENKMKQLLKKHRTLAAEHTKEMNKSPSDLANDMTFQEEVTSSKVVDGEVIKKRSMKKNKSSIKNKRNTSKHMTLDEFYDDEPVVKKSKETKKIVTTASLSPKSDINTPAIVEESAFLLDMLEEEKEKKIVSSEEKLEESNFIADMIEEEKNKVVSSEKLNDRQEDIFTDSSDDKEKPVVNIIAGDESNCSSISESTSPSGKVVKRFDVEKSIEKFEAAKRKHSSSSTTLSKKKIKDQALNKMKKAIRFSKSNSTSSPQDDTVISSTDNEAVDGFSPNLTSEFTNKEESGVPSAPLKGYEHRLAQALATSNRPETAVAFLKEEDIPLSPQFIDWINKKESSLWTMNKEELVQYWLDVIGVLLSHVDMTEIIVDTVGEVFVSVNDYFSSTKEEDTGAVDKEVTPPMPVMKDDEKPPIKKKEKPKSALKSVNKRSYRPKETIDAWHKIDAFLNRTSNMQTDDTTASELKTELLRLAKRKEEGDDSSIKTEQCSKSEDSIVTECPDKEDEASIVTESPNNKDDKSIVTETPSEAQITPSVPVDTAEMAEKPEMTKESVATEELPREDWRKLLKALLEEVEKEEVEAEHTEELHEFISNEQDVLDSYERKASTSAEAKHDTVETSTALVPTKTMDTTVDDNNKTPEQKKKKKSVKKKPKVKEPKVWEKTEDSIVDTGNIDKIKKHNKKDQANQLMAQELKVWEKDVSDNSTAASSNLVKGDASLQTAATGSTVDTTFSVTSCNGLRVEVLKDVSEITSGIKRMILCKCNEYTPKYSQDISNRYA